MSRLLALVSLALSVIVAIGGWLALIRADDAKPAKKSDDKPAAKQPAETDNPFAPDVNPGPRSTEQPAFPAPATPKPPIAPKQTLPPPQRSSDVVNVDDPDESLGGKTAGETPVARALAEHIVFEFHDTPFSDVVDEIAKKAGINVIVDRKALAEAGSTLDFPVTCLSHGASLGAGLRRMLGECDLAYVAMDETVLLITTIDKAKEKLIVRTYDIRDLTVPLSPAPHNEFAVPSSDLDTQSVIDAITSVVALASWDSAGGNGSIAPVEATLVVKQTRDNHRAVAELLAALRKVRPQPGAINRGEAVFVNSNPAEERIRDKLNTRQDMDFSAANLSDFEDYLIKQGLPVVFDKKRLAEAGVASGAPVAAFKARNIPLKFAVRQILSELDLGYVVRDEMLVITTLDAKKEATRIAVYPVGEMPVFATPSFREGDFDDSGTLIGVITSTVQPQTWEAQGGGGAVFGMPTANALVILQTDDVHEEIGKLMAKLRAIRHDPKDMAANQAGEAKDKNEVVVRTYMLVNGEDKSAEQVVAAISNLIEPKSWTGGTAYLGKIPGGIIVRQTRAVQQRIANLLKEIQGTDSPLLRDAGLSRRGFGQSGAVAPGGAFNTPAERLSK